MNELNIVSSVRDGLSTALNNLDEVVLLGEDIGENGGVFRATDGLIDEYPSRVFDTPLAESGIVGTSIGMSLYGLRPVAEIQFMGFIYPAVDQIVSHASRFRTRSRGNFNCPIVIRAPYGGGIEAPELHSESTEAIFSHIPGIKTVIPSTPYDTKGLLLSAIEDPDPVLFLEPKQIYRAVSESVPNEYYTEPIGKAQIRTKGDEITAISWGAMMEPTLEAAKEVEHSVEVIDLRTISPLDIDTIINSIKKTGRCIIVHEAPKTNGMGAEIMATIQEEAFYHQKAPIKRVTGHDTPYPLRELEEYYLPTKEEIKNEIIETMSKKH